MTGRDVGPASTAGADSLARRFVHSAATPPRDQQGVCQQAQPNTATENGLENSVARRFNGSMLGNTILTIVGLVAMAAVGCSSAGSGKDAGGAGGSGGTGVPVQTGGSVADAPASSGSGGVGGATSACIGRDFLAALGKDTVLVGGAMEDATAAKAAFDGRYLYLSGGFFDGNAPCASCAIGCTASGTSCSNAEGCGWWGCWQWDQDPPGQYVVDFVSKNEKASPKQIPMFTYYEELQGSGLKEGATQVPALGDAAFLARYFADWRLVLQKIGSHVALLHLEPDFWGYVQQANSDPHAVAAKVTAANPTDCAGYENSAAGFARCLVHMVRVYAPNAKVGLHASAWGTGFDVFGNRDAKLDVPGEAQKMATFLTALGAKDGDFIVSDPSDRDAGFYQVTQSRDTWWDDTKVKLPNFRQAFTWTKALAEKMGMPILLWQIPVGNMGLDNTPDHYKDNRLDYFFAHMDEVVAAHIVGLFFGAGADGPTTPETDGGNFVSKTAAYRSAGGTKVCPL
jgi:hypothetical protein